MYADGTDPDSRRTYPWGMEDKQMLSFHKEVIRIHRDYSSLKTGSLVFLNLEQNIICFGRFNECEACITAINISGEYKSIEVPGMEAWHNRRYKNGFAYKVNTRRLFDSCNGISGV